MSQQSFVAQMTPYAQYAAAATGINADLILAQWGNETAWGSSYAEKNNVGNVGVYGGGPNPSFPTLDAGVGAYINFINGNSRYDSVRQATTIQAQAVALGASGYASGQYNDGSGPGSSLLSELQGMGVNVGAAPGVAQTVNSTNSAASSSNAANATVTGTTPANTPDSTDIGGVSYTGTEQQTSALSTIEANLTAYGFTGPQVKQLTSWAWGEITNNVDPTQIAVDLQNQPAFKEQFPGFGPANAELAKKGLQAVSVTQYMQYQTQVEGMVRAAGLPTNMVDKDMIGKLIGGNVSTTEMSARINDAVTLAYQSTPEQQRMFNDYFGSNYQFAGMGPHDVQLTHGQIAALALNPQRAEPLIHEQITAGQIGGSGVTSGVGAISEGLAMRLAQNGITPAAAVSGFQQIGPLAKLEQQLPGTRSNQDVVGANTLAESQFLGTAGATRAIQVAQEVRKAPFTGGGGFQQSSRGVSVGNANNLGPTYTNS